MLQKEPHHHGNRQRTACQLVACCPALGRVAGEGDGIVGSVDAGATVCEGVRGGWGRDGGVLDE